jgi:hypothetical protein
MVMDLRLHWTQIFYLGCDLAHSRRSKPCAYTFQVRQKQSLATYFAGLWGSVDPPSFPFPESDFFQSWAGPRRDFF